MAEFAATLNPNTPRTRVAAHTIIATSGAAILAAIVGWETLTLFLLTMIAFAAALVGAAASEFVVAMYPKLRITRNVGYAMGGGSGLWIAAYGEAPPLVLVIIGGIFAGLLARPRS